MMGPTKWNDLILKVNYFQANFTPFPLNAATDEEVMLLPGST